MVESKKSTQQRAVSEISKFAVIKIRSKITKGFFVVISLGCMFQTGAVA